MLGAESVRRFEEHGWLSLPRVFDGDEVASISDEFEATMTTYANGFNAVAEEDETHDGSVWTFISGGIEHTPAMCALLDEPRICDSVTALLGEDWNYAGGDGAFYTGDTSFHVDNDHCIHHGGMFSLKVAIYLDEVGPGQGCLRVFSGSHRLDHPLRQAVSALELEVERDHPDAETIAAEHPGAVDVPSSPGDVVIFNHDICAQAYRASTPPSPTPALSAWLATATPFRCHPILHKSGLRAGVSAAGHGSFGGSNRRRMFTMNCTRHANTPHEMATLERYGAKNETLTRRIRDVLCTLFAACTWFIASLLGAEDRPRFLLQFGSTRLGRMTFGPAVACTSR